MDVPYFSLPNLMTAEAQVPEFLQHAASPEALSAAVSQLLGDDERRAGIVKVFRALRAELARGADERAARAVLEVAGAG